MSRKHQDPVLALMRARYGCKKLRRKVVSTKQSAEAVIKRKQAEISELKRLPPDAQSKISEAKKGQKRILSEIAGLRLRINETAAELRLRGIHDLADKLEGKV